MANFDSNHWQQINISPNSENTGQGQSMDGSVLYTKQGTGSVFFTDTNTTAAEQLWQIFAFNTSYYVLRTQGSGPEGYMNTGLGSGGSTPGNTVPLMANYLISDDSMFWKISPWGDGTFFFTNAANGTAWNLAIKPNSLMAMTSNISAPQDAQRFSFTQQGTIDDVRYSSVLLGTQLASTASTNSPATAASSSTSSTSSISPTASSGTSTSVPSQTITATGTPTTATSSPSSSPATNMQPPNQTPANHTGISSGAAAGIGIGCGAVVIIIIAVVGLILFRWRRARRMKAQPIIPYEISGKSPSFQQVQEYKTMHELGMRDVPLAELGMRDVPPAELPGATHRGQVWAEWPGHH